jgi:hypothetical protein
MSEFVKQLFSESGLASFSRVGSFLALLAACVWVTLIVWHTRVLPALDGVTFFICSLYALGKAGQTMQRLGGRAPQGAPPSVATSNPGPPSRDAAAGDSRLRGKDANEVAPAPASHAREGGHPRGPAPAGVHLPLHATPDVVSVDFRWGGHGPARGEASEVRP